MIGLILLVPVVLIIIFMIMENSNSGSGLARTSAKDFFLHLGAIVALYTVTISFINLLFTVINEAFPEINRNYYAWGGGSEISLPVATLIVVFPLFIVLSYFVQRIYAVNPEKKELTIRKWLTYITLFVAGIILAGDLVTVLYKFLDGQDLTAAFLLKALAVLVVAGAVFGFYLQDIRDRIQGKVRKFWAIGTGIVILVSIILGFGVLGSPKTQRLIRYDNQKVSDLQNMQWQAISYWQTYGSLPLNLNNVPLDQQTKTPYQYRKTGDMTFELCAEFNRASEPNQVGYYSEYSYGYPTKIGPSQNDDWTHQAGLQCFSRVIDPIAYPTQVRG